MPLSQERISVSAPGSGRLDGGAIGVLLLSAVCGLTWTATSYARWADFAYRTFDLAYYVQALWQLIHGRFEVSLENVPLLGNHVEPIVFLIAPPFFLARHPMLFVVLQNCALAMMGPIGYRIARRLGFSQNGALLLAGALLLTPATGYIALHEFHPEAFAAPFLLLMLQAWLSGSRARHWLWFCAALACKENIALLLVSYCLVQLIAERKRGFHQLRAWFLWPMLVAAGWFLICTLVITPRFNAGNIDYAALYNRLGHSGGEILRNAVAKPQLFLHALLTSVRGGNLLPALLFPFLALPLFRLRWCVIATPILLQHLLSWRSSEWTIYFHYAAPLLPFFWFAAAEGLARTRILFPVQRFAPALMMAACLSAEFILGPIEGIVSTAHEYSSGTRDRARKNAVLAEITPGSSVVAPFPYLSHLAMRERLYSLHYILKGLKTLSRDRFDPPPPTDFVLIDYADSATFDSAAGFYHPAMKTVDGGFVPSSDQLLHQFLTKASWQSQSTDELTLLRRGDATPLPDSAETDAIQIDASTRLLGIQKSADLLPEGGRLEIKTRWSLAEPRDVIPWLELRLKSKHDVVTLTRGLCLPEAKSGISEELWQITTGSTLPLGTYSVEAILWDNSRRSWADANSPSGTGSVPLVAPIQLGDLTISEASGQIRQR